jgi:hypothetical protein
MKIQQQDDLAKANLKSPLDSLDRIEKGKTL